MILSEKEQSIMAAHQDGVAIEWRRKDSSDQWSRKVPGTVWNFDKFEYRVKPKTAMISQPMYGLSDDEITETKDRATKYLTEHGYEVINTLFDDLDESSVKNVGAAYLAKSIEALAKADVLYCCRGWNKARGCKFEHDIAVAYGIPTIVETRIRGVRKLSEK